MNAFVNIDNDSKLIRLDQISGLCGIDASDIYEIYPYGSRVYGTNSEASDYDFIVVYTGDYEKDSQQYDSHDGRNSAHTYSVQKWKEHLVAHKMFALECTFLQGPYQKMPFILDKTALRVEVSSKTSNSWVKCKKKLEVENDYPTGIKSLFHSFRMPMFGIQIAKYGKIVDYSEANRLWFEEFKPMLTERPSWDAIKTIYQPRHNALMSEFRTYAELK